MYSIFQIGVEDLAVPSLSPAMTLTVFEEL